MTTVIYKMEVKITTPSGEIASNNVSVRHALNDIPTATINLVPRTDDELATIKEIETNMFKNFTIKTVINGVPETIFKGGFVGAQSNVTQGGVSATAQLYGGLYKLSQMSCFVPGLHVLGDHSMVRLTEAGYKSRQNLFSKTTIDPKNFTDPIDMFDQVLGKIFQQVTSGFSGAVSGDEVGDVYGTVSEAVNKLYNLHNSNNANVLTTELNKILKASGLKNDVFDIYGIEAVKNITGNVSSNPQATFWDILVNLCEAYQMAIGTHNSFIYVIPNSPIGKPSIELKPDDMISIAINPFPLKIPTRCYYTVPGARNELDKDQTSNGVVPGEVVRGSFPTGAAANSPTKFEQKLGTIRALIYDNPGFLFDTLPNPSKIDIALAEKVYDTLPGFIKNVVPFSKNQMTNSIKKKNEAAQREINDKYAQAYLIKEIFKHRTGNITMRYFPEIPVGAIVSFTDPFFKKKYQAYVIEVTHSINTSNPTTTARLQFVMGEKEIEFLDLESGGYLDNLLYPEYNSKNLNTLLGLPTI